MSCCGPSSVRYGLGRYTKVRPSCLLSYHFARVCLSHALCLRPSLCFPVSSVCWPRSALLYLPIILRTSSQLRTSTGRQDTARIRSCAAEMADCRPLSTASPRFWGTNGTLKVMQLSIERFVGVNQRQVATYTLQRRAWPIQFFFLCLID